MFPLSLKIAFSWPGPPQTVSKLKEELNQFFFVISYHTGALTNTEGPHATCNYKYRGAMNKYVFLDLVHCGLVELAIISLSFPSRSLWCVSYCITINITHYLRKDKRVLAKPVHGGKQTRSSLKAGILTASFNL